MWDYLDFSIDGEQMAAICGEQPWTQKEFYIEGEGEHILRWSYHKDASDAEGEDKGQFRLVSVTPFLTLSFLAGEATDGEPPDKMSFYADAGTVILPDRGTLARPKHTFAGWSDGRTVYAAGSGYPCNANVMTLTAIWARKELVAPVIDAPDDFFGDTTTATISAREGAMIYYTLDGSEPVPGSSGTKLYHDSFIIDATMTIRAIAVMDDYFDSPEASITVTQNLTTFGEAVNAPALEFTTEADVGWRRVKGESPDGYALRSGVIGNNATSRIETVVEGAGLISFSSKVAGETVKNVVYDGLAFLIDGVQQGGLMGNEDWNIYAFAVLGEGFHTLSWLYVKDETDEDVKDGDCAWIDSIMWTQGATSDVVVDVGDGKNVAVPRTWLDSHPALVAMAGGDMAAALVSTAANGRKVWECYVLGLDPEKADEDFKIVSFPMKADGTPDVDNIVFDPSREKWNVQGARAVLKGASELGGEWRAVTEENKASFRFFKVVVELP